MKALFATYDGLGKALEIELKKLKSAVNDSGTSYCVVDENPARIGELLYKIQIATHAITVVGAFEFTGYNELCDKLKETYDASVWELDGSPYVIRCTRVGEHDFGSPDVMEAAKQVINLKVENKDAQTATIRYFISGNKCFYGLDLAGIDMSKRDYRIFRHSSSVKGCTAAAVLAHSGFKAGELLVDPFCKDGTVTIEAAFWVNLSSVRKFIWDKLAINNLFKNIEWRKEIEKWDSESKASILGTDCSAHCISAARKNIQIAGLKGHIQLAREDLTWLSTRFKNVDRIVSILPSPTKRFSEKKVISVYSELLEQALIILKKGGTLSGFLMEPELFVSQAEEKGFSVERHPFSMGSQKGAIIILKK